MLINQMKIFLLLILVLGCKQENPTITETGYGKILILSNVEKGEIFIGGKFSGLVTPDTLELLAVKHDIKVRKEGHFSEEKKLSFTKDQILTEKFTLVENNLERTVLIENFMVPDCDTCTFPNDKIEKLKIKYGTKIQIINYPSISSNNNSNLIHNLKNDINRRLEYYNIIEPVNFILDGIFSESIESQSESRLLDETILSISIGDTIAHGNNLVLTVFVDVFDLDGYDFNNLFLIVALTENNVELSNSTDSNLVNFVLRSFVQGSTGDSFTGINKKGRARFAFSKTLDPRWKKEDLKIICFVQNRLTKEIIQVGTSRILFQ